MPLNAPLILKRRKELRLNMAKAGRLAGFRRFPSQTWYRLETGRRSRVSADTLAALARVLGLPPADLLTPPPASEASPSDTPAR
jgi:transcriptional regulator with XRE-family HTH domain